jgi:hypothetical protein
MKEIFEDRALLVPAYQAQLYTATEECKDLIKNTAPSCLQILEAWCQNQLRQ